MKKVLITLDSAVKICGLDPDVATAISMAMEKAFGDETEAAIAMALHLYMNENVHDKESYVITIKENRSDWDYKGQFFRKLPR